MHCGDGCVSGACERAAGPTTLPAPTSSSSAPPSSSSVAPPGERSAFATAPGSFNVSGTSGVPAMHAALLADGRVMFLDKVENYTQVRLASGAYAYSVIYDPDRNTVAPLAVRSNAFCSGGTFLADGTLISAGGNDALPSVDPTVGNGFSAIRYLAPNALAAGWTETGNKLASARWYASVQMLNDSSVFVASGSLNGLDSAARANNNPTYEMLDPAGVPSGVNYVMDLLQRNEPYYMYPFVHLLLDGTLFVFVARQSQIFDPYGNRVLKELPDLPGLFRTYPSTGTSVLLPLSRANSYSPEVLICGGGASPDINAQTDASCGRIRPLDATPSWEMDHMPSGRVMVEGVLLPDGTVLFLNGAGRGAQGFGFASEPALAPLIYNPTAPLGSRFSVGAPSTIPRMYHSVALLLADGRVLVAGSNPVEQPVLQASAGVPFPTEFRVEIYTPPYLAGAAAGRRPTNISLSTSDLYPAGDAFDIGFVAPPGAKALRVALCHGGFVTHSLHMGQRVVMLDTVGFVPGASAQMITVSGPPGANVAPAGPWWAFVVVDGVPGVG
ncbi:hypothetical protein EJ06DRAFT_498597, partial [Trichodelitschia bisporula]